MKRPSLFFWLVLLTFAVVPAAIALTVFVPRYRQSRAVARLQKAGVQLGSYASEDPWLGSRWVVGITAESNLDALPFLADLFQVNELSVVAAPKFNDEHARILSRLPSLTTLTLDRVDVGDSGFAHVRNIKNLYTLNLNGTRITGRTLERLRSADTLQALMLDSTAVTDADLSHIAGLPLLSYLQLAGTSVGDAGLLHLVTLKNLQHLDLHGTRVTDRGMVHLKGHTKLAELFLGETAVTGEGLRSIAGHPLERLFLNGTQVDDAALEQVAKCLHLKSVKLARTRVTDAGMHHLAGIRSLEGVVLTKTQVGDSGAAEIIRGCKALRTLQLSGTQVSDGLATAISDWPHGFIDVSNTRFSAAGFQQIRKFYGTVVYTERTPDGQPGKEIRGQQTGKK